MDTLIVFSLIVWPFVLIYWGKQLFDKMVLRFFPQYAAKRKLKRMQRDERIRTKYLRKKDAKETRLREWAEAHPDHPTAKALLAQATFVPLADTTGRDFAAELRVSQQEDDEFNQRRENMRAAAKQKAEQMLEWAIANPTSPEAQRHLNEKLAEADQLLTFLTSQVKYCQFILQTHEDDESPEAIMKATELAEAEQKKADFEQLIQRIQLALKESDSSIRE